MYHLNIWRKKKSYTACVFRENMKKELLICLFEIPNQDLGEQSTKWPTTNGNQEDLQVCKTGEIYEKLH